MVMWQSNVKLPDGPVNPRCLAIMAAIFHQEGTFSPTTPGFRHKNPADLRSWGTFPVADGFVQFPTMPEGVLAAYKDVLVNKGTTLRAFIAKFAPPNENATSSYLTFVSQWTGIGPDEVI